MPDFGFPFVDHDEANAVRQTVDTTPVIALTFPSRHVVLSVESGGPVYYRTDGVDPVAGGGDNGSARLTTDMLERPVALGDPNDSAPWEIRLIADATSTVHVMPSKITVTSTR